MKATELETKNAGAFAAFAAMDCMRRNNNNKSHYSTADRRWAQTAADLLDNAYSAKIFVNYRKTFITVKLENPRVKDRRILSEVEDLFESKGVQKIATNQGITYRIRPSV